MELDFAEVLLEVVDRRASDLHLTAGAPPMLRVRGRLTPMEGYPAMTPTDTREIVYSILSNAQRQRLENQLAAGLRLPDPRHGSVPRQRVLPAFLRRRGLPPDPVRCGPARLARAAARGGRVRQQAAGARARHRTDRLGQVDHAGLADRRDQLRAGGAHHDDRGPDRVPPPAQEVHRQPARARLGRHQLRRRAEGGPAPGP